MKLELCAVQESERARLSRFLRGVFHSPEDAVFTAPAQMHWKYWEPHPDWNGPRSYAYSNDDFIAHACAWPFSLLAQDGQLTGANPIDWAAGNGVPGAGALLLRDLRALGDISCCIGGTEAAQKIIRQCGYKPVTKMHRLARPLRPLRQTLTHQRKNWKLPARALRNLVWSMQTQSVPAGWTAEPLRPADISDELFPAPAQDLAVARRTPTLFEYMAKCPTARFQLYLVRHNGQPRGYFLLSFVPGQARVADAWIEKSSWDVLFSLAIQTALSDRSAAEITTAVTLNEALAGAAACGFRQYDEIDVMLFDPKKHLAATSHFHIQMLDTDMSFLHQNVIEYVT